MESAIVLAHPGYEVWAGDSSYFLLPNQYDIYYSLAKYTYTKIGGDTKTAHFSTGNFKYYVVVAKYYACVDAIRFDDGVYGQFGYKTYCPPPALLFDSTTFNAYITDDLYSLLLMAFIVKHLAYHCTGDKTRIGKQRETDCEKYG
jgi:hypothetical protein